MELSPLDEYFETKQEPMKSFLLALKDVILRYDSAMMISWKWRTPFFSFGEKMICYFSIQNKTKRPYLGFGFGSELHHPALLSEGRKMIKVLYFDENEDVDVDLVYEILDEAVQTAKFKSKKHQ
ncbi:MAG: DUF1801 domain-containing protein [Cyclobacteriaceae bacterium]